MSEIERICIWNPTEDDATPELMRGVAEVWRDVCIDMCFRDRQPVTEEEIENYNHFSTYPFTTDFQSDLRPDSENGQYLSLATDLSKDRHGRVSVLGYGVCRALLKGGLMLDALYVHPSAQKMGLGRALLKSALNVAYSDVRIVNSDPAVELVTSSGRRTDGTLDHPASFYARIGFDFAHDDSNLMIGRYSQIMSRI
jgi:GNAT superfamily N-acetyltransferase